MCLTFFPLPFPFEQLPPCVFNHLSEVAPFEFGLTILLAESIVTQRIPPRALFFKFRVGIEIHLRRGSTIVLTKVLVKIFSIHDETPGSSIAGSV